MFDLINNELGDLYYEFVDFAKVHIEPFANQWEKNEYIPKDTISLCAKLGYLGCMIPKEYEGNGWDAVTYGVFNEAIGRASASLTALFNVHTMVLQTILRWGTEEQKKKWIPKMVKGKLIGAFALTEPGAGSDVKKIQSEYSLKEGNIVLNGKKRWITFGGIADIFLVFGQLDGKPSAFIVERNSPGFNMIPISDMLGFRAAHIAALEFNECIVKKENLIGKLGIALTHIAPYALEYGRISVAFTSLGILRACIEICSSHVLERKTFDMRLIEHGVIGEMITNMGVDIEAARLLCLNACKAKDANTPDSVEKIMIAKYFASKAAAVHSTNAVQIMGAIGCNENHLAARLFRDSKILEIIEGSTQIQQMILGRIFARKNKRDQRKGSS